MENVSSDLFLCPNIGAFILRIVPNSFPMELMRKIDFFIIQDLFYLEIIGVIPMTIIM